MRCSVYKKMDVTEEIKSSITSVFLIICKQTEHNKLRMKKKIRE